MAGARYLISMNTSDREHWFRTIIIVALIYVVVGVASSAFAGRTTSHQMVVAWRLAAWIISAIAFAAHVWYGRHRFSKSCNRFEGQLRKLRRTRKKQSSIQFRRLY